MTDIGSREAYDLLIRSIKDYRPRHHLTQKGLPEPERLNLKIKLFVGYEQAKLLRREESNATEVEKTIPKSKHSGSQTWNLGHKR